MSYCIGASAPRFKMNTNLQYLAFSATSAIASTDFDYAPEKVGEPPDLRRQKSTDLTRYEVNFTLSMNSRTMVSGQSSMALYLGVTWPLSDQPQQHFVSGSVKQKASERSHHFPRSPFVQRRRTRESSLNVFSISQTKQI